MRTSLGGFLVVTLLDLASALGAGDALADDAVHGDDRVEWSPEWPRFRPIEVVDTAAFAAGTIAIATSAKPPTHASWHGGILFDVAVRDALRSGSPGGQKTAQLVSDVLYFTGGIAPNVLDLWVVALGIHQNPDVAAQMALINMQSLGLTGVVTLASEFGTARARPFVQDCLPDGTVRDASGRALLGDCGATDAYKSFFSGHAVLTATMAGLTCVHHQHLPLYGGGVADLVPCLTMIALSATTGVARIVADRHWSTDVLTGWGVGALSGYVLPSVLHYGFGHGRPVGEMRLGPARLVPVLQSTTAGAGLAVMGTY